MDGGLVTSVNHRSREIRNALHGPAAHHEGRSHPMFGKRLQKSPQSNAHAIIEYLLLNQVTHTGGLRRPDLAKWLGSVVAFLDGEFGALFKVDHE
jgi:hypothetical protein